MPAIYLTDEQYDHLVGLIDRAEDDFLYAADDDGNGYTAEDVDQFNQATESVRVALHVQGEMVLSFGDGADRSTFDTMFGHLSNRYIIQVNGVDMICTDVYRDGKVGLYGYLYGEDPDHIDSDHPLGFDWSDIQTLKVY